VRSRFASVVIASARSTMLRRGRRCFGAAGSSVGGAAVSADILNNVFSSTLLRVDRNHERVRVEIGREMLVEDGGCHVFSVHNVDATSRWALFGFPTVEFVVGRKLVRFQTRAAQRRGVDAFMAEFGGWLRSKKQTEAA
jgi:hypothetical protein